MRNHQIHRVVLLSVLSAVLIFAFGSASQGMKIEGDKYRIDLREEGAFFDRAAFYDDLEDYYHVTINPFAINPTGGNITIAFWIQTPTKTGDSEWRTAVSYAVPNHRSDEFTIRLQCGSDVYSEVYIDGHKWFSGFPLYSNEGEQWHHFAMTWNNSDKRANIYIDGIFKSEHQFSPNNLVNVEEGSLVLGQEQDTIGGGFQIWEAFDGGLRHVAIWNRLLSKDDIGEVKAGTPLSIAGDKPIGYWFWRPTLESPDIRDGYVHVGVDNSVTFEPESGEWENYVSGYEWSNCLKETGVEPNDFSSTSGGRYEFYDEGKKKVYCRAKISYSAVGSPYEVVPYPLPLRIPIWIWNCPEVEFEPPSDLIIKDTDDTNGDLAYSPQEIQ